MKLGYTLIYVDDVAATMKFYEKAFGLKSGFLHDSGQYGEMVTGETKLGFVHHDTAGDHGFKYQKLSLKKNAPGLEIAFVADDVKKAFEKAVKAGVISTSPLWPSLVKNPNRVRTQPQTNLAKLNLDHIPKNGL